MTRLLQHIEQVRLRMNEIASRELALVRALGEALSTVDQKLLHDVQTVTAEHDARRGAILGELHVLASRIGAFPGPHEPMAELDAEREFPSYLAAQATQQALGRGDWRQAARTIDEELDFDVSVEPKRRAC